MFDFLPRLAVRRPVFTTMLVVLFVVLGAFSYLGLRTDLMPDVEFPVVSVSTVYPGAGPEEIESQVTDRLEEAIATLANIDQVTSFSQENVSLIIVQFDLGVDLDQAALDVRDRIDGIRGQLPAALEPSVVQKFDIGAQPIVNLALSGPQGVDALYELADLELRDRLSRVDGVATVGIVGGREREVEVLVHADRLVAYGVTLAEVVDRIRAENVTVPAGRVTEPRADIPVRVIGEYRSIDQLSDLRLFLREGQSVRLAELATVRDGFEDVRQIARYNGEPSVSLAIQKRTDANTVTTAEGVLREVEAIRADLPPGTQLAVVRDQSAFIRDSINDVLVNLLLGIALTTAVLFLFLHSWRGTIVAAVAMPATIVSTFLLMSAAGFSLNVMTLMALGITVGILVTNTIVVLENIYRHLDKGQRPDEAASRGTSEVAVAVTASTLTNVVVFTPIAFMDGIIGQFFYAFGLTVVFATLFSILMSFTLAPLLAARLLRPYETSRQERQGLLAPVWRWWDDGLRTLEANYRAALGWALGRPRNGWIVIAIVLLFSAAALAGTSRFVGGEFLPQGDEGAVRITLDLPPGTPLDQTSSVAARAEAALTASIPEIDAVLTTIAGAGSGVLSAGGGANTAELLVTTREPRRPTETLVREMRSLMADLPDAAVFVIATDPGGAGGGQAPIQLRITGPDFDVLRQLAGQVTDALQFVPALSDVESTLEDPRPELAFRPDTTTLADYNLTAGGVGQLVRSSIEGAVAGVFRDAGGRERDIRVRLHEDARHRVAQIADLQVRTPHGAVALGTLGAFVEEASPPAIQRVDRVRTAQIDAQIGAGTLTDAVAAVERQMAGVTMPAGYAWHLSGQAEQFGDTVGIVLMALLLAITLTYIVLAMLLESFIHPFTIMLTLPLGAVGALLGLFLWGTTMNIFSMMAIIMLVGIVVNNAILILDYTAQLRAKGSGIVEALLEAAPARLRAIVMTNLAIVCALIPQALAGGAGAVFRVPMAVVTMGGVLLSAVFTLLLIPVIYTKLDRFDRLGRRAPEERALEPALRRTAS
jgi:hydrophobic/amphiphilic exporter-1 (mainly G- bacteria), HAE1 family